MSMTLNKIMELSGYNIPGLAISHIREALGEAGIEINLETVNKKYDIVSGRIKYKLPNNIISIDGAMVIYSSIVENLMADDNWEDNDLDTFTDTGGSLEIGSDGDGQYCIFNKDIIEQGKIYKLKYSVLGKYGDNFSFVTSETGEEIEEINASEDDNIVAEFVSPDTGKIKIRSSGTGIATIFDIGVSLIGSERYRPMRRLLNSPSLLADSGELPLRISKDVFGDIQENTPSFDSDFVYMVIGNNICIYELTSNFDEEMNTYYGSPAESHSGGFLLSYTTDSIFVDSNGVICQNVNEDSIVNLSNALCYAIIEYLKYKRLIESDPRSALIARKSFYSKIAENGRSIGNSDSMISGIDIFSIK